MTAIDIRTDPKLLRQVQHFKRRAKDLSTQVVQLRASREKWRKKALAESEERQVWQRRYRAQYARAELWKHRALNKFPITAPHGGSPQWVDYEDAVDYLAEREAS